MNTCKQVAIFEYSRNIFKKSFLIMLFSVPLLISLSLCFGLTIESLRINHLPAGYIDEAGFIKSTQLPDDVAKNTKQIKWISFKTTEEAREALVAGNIQAYFLIPASYNNFRHIEVGYLETPGENAWQQFYALLRLNLMEGQSSDVTYRLVSGNHVIIRSVDGRRQTSQGSPTFGLMMPLFITIAFIFMILISSGYMMGALVDEKENRTMEVLLTSISHGQLMTGKIIGIVAISLTLLLVWTVTITGGVLIAERAGIIWFSNLYMDWRSILETIIIGIPAYILAASLMISIGALVGTNQEGQSVSTLMFLLHGLPLYISIAYLYTPHAVIPVTLSLLPFSAVTTIGIRNVFTIIPIWQVVTSFTIQCVCALGAMWLAGRTLRFSIQHYGVHFTWRKLLNKQYWYTFMNVKVRSG